MANLEKTGKKVDTFVEKTGDMVKETSGRYPWGSSENPSAIDTVVDNVETSWDEKKPFVEKHKDAIGMGLFGVAIVLVGGLIRAVFRKK